MAGILVYPRCEAERNRFVVQKLADLLGVQLVEPSYREKADFVINRSNDYTVAEYYENMGIRVFNPSSLSKLANDKQACYDFMQDNGIEVMPTRYSTPPFVKKPVDGHGGDGVVWCESTDDYDDSMVCQKPASDLGRDVRVWVLGGEIVCAILRSSDTDFRSNFCLGGNAEIYHLSDDEVALVKHIISLLDGDYYGVDFVFDHGRMVFNEIEDTVGARMIYTLTDIDIIAEYAQYIKNVVES